MINQEKHEEQLGEIAADLKAKIRELETQISPLQEHLGVLRVQLDLIERALGARSAPVSGSAQPPSKGTSRSGVSDRVFEIIRDAGRPLHVTEIKSQYVARGFTIPGQGNESNLLVYIVRDSRFSRVAKGTYSLTDQGANPKIPNKPKTKRRRRRKP